MKNGKQKWLAVRRAIFDELPNPKISNLDVGHG